MPTSLHFNTKFLKVGVSRLCEDTTSSVLKIVSKKLVNYIKKKYILGKYIFLHNIINIILNVVSQKISTYKTILLHLHFVGHGLKCLETLVQLLLIQLIFFFIFFSVILLSKLTFSDLLYSLLSPFSSPPGWLLTLIPMP